MKVIEIIEAHLRANGFDGLVLPEIECGCLMSDGLAPCDGTNIGACRPGYRVKNETFSDGWAVSTEKPEQKP